MGEVYRATDERLARDVAVKILRSSFTHDPDRLRRFELEARAAAALSHPNIVAIYDIEMHQGSPYIVSELLQGETLRRRLESGPLSLRLAGEYGLQIAEGLAAAHEKNIIHRDLKPENVFITREGRAKILDFGVAKLTSQESSENSSIESMATQTKAGSILGTVCYMSPEQVRGKPVDHRCDIFSFGAVLYEMVTGKRAFFGETEADTMIAVLQENPPELTAGQLAIPPSFRQIILHCLEKDPENRFQSARDLAFALGTVSTTATKQTEVLRSPPVRWRQLLPWFAGLSLLALGVLLGLYSKSATAPVTYRRITFQRGTIYSARFSNDTHAILYDALWNGRPSELFTTVGDSPLARSLGFSTSHMLALSPNDQLALLLHGSPDLGHFLGGVLAQAPLAGGTPREILEDVPYADWSPKGDLAVVHNLQGEAGLEYPIGKVLFKTAGWISDLRFSPDGTRIAFMDHPAVWDDRGSVCVVDLSGRVTTLAADWKSEGGLDWNPRGDEIWFTATNSASTSRALWAVNEAGRKRPILAMPGGMTLQDVAPDGRVLISTDVKRVVMEWTGENTNEARDLSWYDWSVVRAISKDGHWLLFEESSEPAGPNYAVAIRNIDGSPPIRLGDGSAGALSPDGKWALAFSPENPHQLSLFPVGAGEARQILLPELEHISSDYAFFLPDGKRVLIVGNLPGRPDRVFLVDLSENNPKPRPIAAETEFLGLPSPDGKYFVGRHHGQLMLVPVDGSSSRPIAQHPPEPGRYSAVQWSSDGKALYLGLTTNLPVRIYRLELTTGKMTFVRELTLGERAGVNRVSQIFSTMDGTEFAYSYFQDLSSLYVVSGLR